MQKCIFYLPYKLEPHGMGARMLRPRKMIEAFCDIGYEVFVISGFSEERKKRIQEIKNRINNGEKYDFMYTESSTMPTLLTDPHHLPLHPFFDFDFFGYIKNRGIKIGLFYCDIYWKFDTYGTALPWWKKQAALKCYEYDIAQYKKLLSQFYVPDMKVCSYLGDQVLTNIASELPPGADNIEIVGRDFCNRNFTKKPLQIFYVGGLGNQYQIVELAKAVYKVPECELTICCRPFEWEKEKLNFSEWMCDRIKIVHKNSDELEPFYEKADICSLMFKPDIYRELAKPFKAYEYLAHEIPVVSTKGTGIGTFVEQNDIGWNVVFSADAIEKVLKNVIAYPELLHEKAMNCKKAKAANLWICRAKQVMEDLM